MSHLGSINLSKGKHETILAMDKVTLQFPFFSGKEKIADTSYIKRKFIRIG